MNSHFIYPRRMGILTILFFFLSVVKIYALCGTVFSYSDVYGGGYYCSPYVAYNWSGEQGMCLSGESASVGRSGGLACFGLCIGNPSCSGCNIYARCMSEPNCMFVEIHGDFWVQMQACIGFQIGGFDLQIEPYDYDVYWSDINYVYCWCVN